MVKTAEELKEYQRLYYQKNKQKINQRQKEYLPRWRHNNEDYKSYQREYYKKHKYKIIEQVKANIKSKPNYYKEYNIKNKHRIRKSLTKCEREKNQGLAMAIDRCFIEEASEKMLSVLCDHYFDCMKDHYYKWYNEKDHYI
jgi:hypothetical protein